MEENFDLPFIIINLPEFDSRQLSHSLLIGRSRSLDTFRSMSIEPLVLTALNTIFFETLKDLELDTFRSMIISIVNLVHHSRPPRRKKKQGISENRKTKFIVSLFFTWVGFF